MEVRKKVIAQSIPTDAVSIFQLSKDLCSSIQFAKNNFWWGHSNYGLEIYWVMTFKLHKKNEDGRLSFPKLDSINNALLPNNFGYSCIVLFLWSVVSLKPNIF